MLGVQVDPDARAGDLALGGQQQVEIIKALWRGSRVLILDEPTSMLTPEAVASCRTCSSGSSEPALAIVFITHKLHEAVALGDRISVLRRAASSARSTEDALRSRSPEELEAEIVRLMFGEEATGGAPVAELEGSTGPAPAGACAPSGEVALELEARRGRGEGTQPGHRGRLARCASARCWAWPASTATASARSPR